MTSIDGRGTESLERYVEELHATGSTLIPQGILFSREELDELETLQSGIPEETVTNGDAGDVHDIHVRRIMVDRAGEAPLAVNQPHSGKIIDVLDSDSRKSAMAALFRSDDSFYIRRAQMNRMLTNSFIGIHLDAASNPDYEYSVIIQLGKDFSGGDFVVHGDDGKRHAYAATFGTVLLTTCKLRHEVARVHSGERNSLVYFYSRHAGANRRESGGT